MNIKEKIIDVAMLTAIKEVERQRDKLYTHAMVWGLDTPGINEAMEKLTEAVKILSNEKSK